MSCVHSSDMLFSFSSLNTDYALVNEKDLEPLVIVRRILLIQKAIFVGYLPMSRAESLAIPRKSLTN